MLSLKMHAQEAIRLIQSKALQEGNVSRWTDLGCGRGTFTKALASCLNSGSTIYAIDQDPEALRSIASQIKSVSIEKYQGDFETMDFPFEPLNGILMANALHYVKKKSLFLQKLIQYVLPNGCLLIIEYDSAIANPWVPYPISYRKLKELMTSLGLEKIEKLHEMPSRFRSSNIYSALIPIS